MDEALGGDLLPGSLTLLIGATGVGKTQLGMHFLQGGSEQEQRLGAVIDLSSRGDSQNHDGYSQRIAGLSLTTQVIDRDALACPFMSGPPAAVFPFLGYGGKRVLRSQMDVDEWHLLQAELNRRLPQLFRFVYRHLIHGGRRFVIDGIEPSEHTGDSIQLDLVELIDRRMLKQDHDWLAREVLREKFYDSQVAVEEHAYPAGHSAAVALVTTKHALLDQLMTAPLADGDLAAGANTVILLGRVMREGEMSRALYIAKHRGSYADSRVIPFTIENRGICF